MMPLYPVVMLLHQTLEPDKGRCDRRTIRWGKRQAQRAAEEKYPVHACVQVQDL